MDTTEAAQKAQKVIYTLYRVVSSQTGTHTILPIDTDKSRELLYNRLVRQHQVGLQDGVTFLILDSASIWITNTVTNPIHAAPK